jgi:polyphenol oxidase
VRVFDRALGNGRSIRVRWTDRTDGDLAIGAVSSEQDERRNAVTDHRWVWLEQVHGDRCIDCDEVGVDAAIGAEADAVVTAQPNLALAIHTADCVPIALWSEDGVLGAVHAGWRGLEAGIIESCVQLLRTKSSEPISAVIGPSIGPECYEFGEVDLERLSAKFGPSVRALTSDGRPALDVRCGIRNELARLNVSIVFEDDTCTSCDHQLYSFRGRGESGRQALVIWSESA